jgi:hypothetical protein
MSTKMPTLMPVGGTVTSVAVIIRYLVILFVIIIVAMLVMKIYKAAKSGSEAAGNAAANTILASKTGIQLVRIIAIRSIVEELKTGYQKYWFGGVNIDEEAWIVALNKIAESKEVVVCSSMYKEGTGRSLKADLESAFDNSDRKKLKSFILGNLS